MNETKLIKIVMTPDLAELFMGVINLNLSHVHVKPSDEDGYCETYLQFRTPQEKAWVKAGEQEGFKKGLESGRREVFGKLMSRPSG